MNKKIIHKKIVNTETNNSRADIGIAKLFGVTRSQSQKNINSGSIKVNGKGIDQKKILKKGDSVEWVSVKKIISKIPIIYEDDSMVVIDKPAGVTVHPAPGEENFTVSEFFKDKLVFADDEPNPGIVHRLDKGTSGVMLIAKNQKAKENLQAQFRNHKIKKIYLALVSGELKPRAGIIDMPLGRDKVHRNKISVNPKGRRAKTRFKVSKYIDGNSLLELQPETGRTHQLRVHLSAIGFPIVGDIRYGQPSPLIDRIFLHAWKIEFSHPTKNEKVLFEASLPVDLKKAIDNLK